MDYISNYKFGSDVSYLFKNKIYPIVKNKKVLDLGCGVGEYLKFFGEGSIGIDISPRNLETAKKNGLQVYKVDLNNPSLKVNDESLESSFELVFTSHVLEHVESPINLLRYANKCLKKGGSLVVSIPNEISFINLFYPYFTKDGNHLYSFTVGNMIELLSQCGFKVVDVYYDYYTVATSKAHVNRLLSIFDILPNLLKNPLSWAFWFVATKESSKI